MEPGSARQFASKAARCNARAAFEYARGLRGHSPQSVARAVKKIASELLTITDPAVSEIGDSKRLVRPSCPMTWSARPATAQRRCRSHDGNHRHSDRNRRPDDQLRDVASH